MDWSLVLASQAIDVSLEHLPGTRRWQLRVAETEHRRARAVLHQFLKENKGWGWRLQIPDSQVQLHWLSLLWVFAITLLHATGGPRYHRALFEPTAYHQGEWWRPFTATWLHADLGHLAMNAALGGPVLGLAMGRYGAGPCLAGTLAAGAAANCLASTLRSGDYVGLGASGVVMAGIGMLAANQVGLWRQGWSAARWILPAVMAGGVLFLETGTHPKGDILVHALGFGFGLLAGVIAVLWPARRAQVLDWLGWVATSLLILLPWVRHARG